MRFHERLVPDLPPLPPPEPTHPPQEIFPQGSAHLAVTRLAEAFSSAKLPVRSVFRANDPSMKVRRRPSSSSSSSGPTRRSRECHRRT